MLLLAQPPTRIVESIGRAMRDDRVTSLAVALSDLRNTGAFDDDALFAPPLPERYSRKLIWRDPAGRFIIVGMSWAPGQGSALHDHGGLWGGEIVVAGAMREKTFRLAERRDDRYRFEQTADRQASLGCVGALNPPLDYHEFGNPGTRVARTVHVYSGDLSEARRFLPEGASWYRPCPVALAYDG
jgi:predicted metal-dependent enzyme (double-stranded beta helix superfamily)